MQRSSCKCSDNLNMLVFSLVRHAVQIAGRVGSTDPRCACTKRCSLVNNTTFEHDPSPVQFEAHYAYLPALLWFRVSFKLEHTRSDPLSDCPLPRPSMCWKAPVLLSKFPSGASSFLLFFPYLGSQGSPWPGPNLGALSCAGLPPDPQALIGFAACILRTGNHFEKITPFTFYWSCDLP